MATVHASREETARRYDVVVPDETDRPVDVSVALNGRLVHQWRAFDGAITAPVALAGLPLCSGFAAWATRRFEGDDLEAATALGRTYFISRGRRYELSSWAGQSVNGINARDDVCFTYTLQQRQHGRLLGTNARNLGGPRRHRDQEPEAVAGGKTTGHGGKRSAAREVRGKTHRGSGRRGGGGDDKQRYYEH